MRDNGFFKKFMDATLRAQSGRTTHSFYKNAKISRFFEDTKLFPPRFDSLEIMRDQQNSDFSFQLEAASKSALPLGIDVGNRFVQ